MFIKNMHKNHLENFSLQLTLEHIIPYRDITGMAPYIEYLEKSSIKSSSSKKGGTID